MNEALASNPNVMELLGHAEALKGLGETERAIALYRSWIEANLDHPLLFAVYFNYGVTLAGAGDLDGAIEQYRLAIARNPDFYAPYINLGGLREAQGALDQAVQQWSELVQRLAPITGNGIGFKTEALKQMGRVFESANLDGSAEAMLSQGLDVNPNQPEVVQHLVALRQRQCKWPVLAPTERVSREALMTSLSPLSMAVYADDPMLQLAAAANYNKREMPGPAGEFVPAWRASPAPRRPGPLRIGYLSSDLREHAIGFLMAEVFELHDKQAVETFAYYCGIQAEDGQKARIRNAFDHWLDINKLGDAELARRMAADGIDILVDVNGYTGTARNKAIALRPAPIIVNWLGFPSTCGSPYHDYIIADDWIIPTESEIYYSERVLRLPCYQPNDRKRIVSSGIPTRAANNLPDEAMVYCCFNGMQKISRFMYERWLQILARVPGSVLWLLGGTDETNQRLQSYAAERGVAPDRVRFAGRMANPDHLARYPLADLFLDTFPYGAHTTASDALWMGVPMLTLSGRSFASRVCGSLVRSAGVPGLVCGTAEEYVERAVAFGLDRASLRPYRERLQAGRASCTLFDTPLLTRRLEELYRTMWQDFQDGRRPRPDLANLDAYLEVGIQEDHEALEAHTIADYPGWYRAKLARRHRFRPIPPDRRLWTEADMSRYEDE